MGINFLETSAMQEYNVEAAFRLLAGNILESSWIEGALEESIQLKDDTDTLTKTRRNSKCSC